jgi:REP element-mobilizing transposase RayT
MRGVHLIFSAYGFWLPNDPRGSGSPCVRAQHIYDAGGEATRVESTRSVARHAHDGAARVAAKAALVRPAVRLNGRQARAAARGIGELLSRVDLTIHALAVLPDHVHVVAASRQLGPDELLTALKSAATRGLNGEGLHPLADYPRKNGRLPMPWADGGWKVFLDSLADVRRAVAYVEQNPVRAGLKPQTWSFVTPYEE